MGCRPGHPYTVATLCLHCFGAWFDNVPPQRKGEFFFLEGKGIRPSTQSLVMVELYQIFHPCGMYQLTLPEPS